jgi:rhamnulokinase
VSAAAYAAVDLGASSGRVLAGHYDGERLDLREITRFANEPVELPDGLHWDLLHLFAHARDGLAQIADLASVGVDTWAVDYGLLDEHGRLLGLPYHYRDRRRAAAVDRSFARVPRANQYALSGIQTQPFNTLLQHEAERGSAALERARRLAMIPDLIAHWLGGDLVNEATNASTTGLLDARTGRWSAELLEGLDLPSGLFCPLVEPGTMIGTLAPRLEIGGARIHAVASHDTASAFVAAPVRGPDAAILSSGTWSLLGVEATAPALGQDALDANLTNERGVDGTTRILRNVMGLWLEQELCRAWGLSAAQIQDQAAAAQAEVPVIDPDDPAFLAPGDLPQRLHDACRRTGQELPDDQGAIARMVYVSLALRYRWVLERLEQILGRTLSTIHVVGGGVRNQLLCQLTADLTRREVVAGPVEATATGNVLVQLRAVGELASLDDARAVSAASSAPVRFTPALTADRADEQYDRFLRALDAPAANAHS